MYGYFQNIWYELVLIKSQCWHLSHVLELPINQGMAQCPYYTAFPDSYLQWMSKKLLRMLSGVTDEPY